MSQANREIVDGVVAEEMANTGQPGMMLKITGGEAGDYENAYGVRVTPNKTMTLDSYFRAGSVTKSVTATAVLQQVDRGRISLDDPIDKYVKQLPNGKQITIRHLLTMRSGLFDYESDLLIAATFLAFPTWNTFSPEGAMQAVRRHRPNFAPNAQYQYCSSNHHALALALEKVTGKDWKRVLIDDIIDPLGLTHTSFPDDSTVPQPEVKGYKKNIFGRYAENGVINANFYGPAGGMVTTLGDLHKWGEAMRDGVLLSAEMQNLRHTSFTAVPWSDEGPTAFGYGYGLIRFGEMLFGHDGWIPGFGIVVFYDPISGLVFSGVENMKSPNLKILSRVMVRTFTRLYPGSMDTPTYTL